MSTLHIIDHPLIQHKLTIMRSKKTGSKDFRELLDEIAMLMGYELTRDLPLKEIEIETPICKCKSKIIAGKKLGVVPILRAGLGMVEGVLNIVLRIADDKGLILTDLKDLSAVINYVAEHREEYIFSPFNELI